MWIFNFVAILLECQNVSTIIRHRSRQAAIEMQHRRCQTNRRESSLTCLSLRRSPINLRETNLCSLLHCTLHHHSACILNNTRSFHDFSTKNSPNIFLNIHKINRLHYQFQSVFLNSFNRICYKNVKS